MTGALVVFSRVPLPGRTKSRLAAELTPHEAALFHRACLYDLHRVLQGMAVRSFLYYTGGSRQDFLRRFPGEVPPGFEELQVLQLSGFSFRRQRGGDLGERMRLAAETVLRRQNRVLILGSDVPGLGESLLRAALRELGSHDLVLGPAADGGYYLLGLRRVYPGLFRGIPWGTGSVLERTLQAARREGLRVALLPVRRDIDTLADLVALAGTGGPASLRKGVAWRLAGYLTENKPGLATGKLWRKENPVYD